MKNKIDSKLNIFKTNKSKKYLEDLVNLFFENNLLITKINFKAKPENMTRFHNVDIIEEKRSLLEKLMFFKHE